MWTNGLPDGFGIFIWADGGEFQGNFRNGKKEGDGVLKKAGLLYEGQFRNDKYHGEGKLRIEGD